MSINKYLYYGKLSLLFVVYMHACLVAWPRWLGKKKKHAVIEVGYKIPWFSSEMMMLWRTRI